MPKVIKSCLRETVIKEQSKSTVAHRHAKLYLPDQFNEDLFSLREKLRKKLMKAEKNLLKKKKRKKKRSRKTSESDIASVSSEEIVDVSTKSHSNSSSSDVPRASSRHSRNTNSSTKEIITEQKTRSMGYREQRLAIQPKTPPKRLSIEDKRDHRASSHHSRISESDNFSRSYRESPPRSSDRHRGRASPQRFPDRHRSRDPSRDPSRDTFDRYKSRGTEPEDRVHRSPSASDYSRASRRSSRDRSVRPGGYKEVPRREHYEDRYSRRPSGKEEHRKSSYGHHSGYRNGNESKREYSESKSVDNKSDAHDSFTERLYNDKQKTYKWKQSNNEDRVEHNRYEYSNKKKEQKAIEYEDTREEDAIDTEHVILDEPCNADQFGDVLDEVLQDFGVDSMPEEINPPPPLLEETEVAFDNSNVKITIDENRQNKFFITIKLLWKEFCVHTRQYYDIVQWQQLLYVLRQILEQRIEPILVGVEERLKAKALRDLYRSHYPRSGDAAFLKQVVNDMCAGKYNDPEAPENKEQTENSETKEPSVCTVTIKKEPDSVFEDNANNTELSVISTDDEVKPDVSIVTIKTEPDSDATNISSKEVNKTRQSDIATVKMDVDETSSSHKQSTVSTVNKEKPDVTIDTIKKERDSDATNISNKKVNKTRQSDIATVKMEVDGTFSSHTQSVISTDNKGKPKASVEAQKIKPNSNTTNICNKEVNKTPQCDIATVKIEVDETSSRTKPSKADENAKTSSKSKQTSKKSTAQIEVTVKNEPATSIVKVENNTESSESTASNLELQAKKRKKEKKEKTREKKKKKDAPVSGHADSLVPKSETVDSSDQKRATKDDDVLVVEPKPVVIDLSDAGKLNVGAQEISQESQDGAIPSNVHVKVENMEMDTTPAQDEQTEISDDEACNDNIESELGATVIYENDKSSPPVEQYAIDDDSDVVIVIGDEQNIPFGINNGKTKRQKLITDQNTTEKRFVDEVDGTMKLGDERGLSVEEERNKKLGYSNGFIDTANISAERNTDLSDENEGESVESIKNYMKSLMEENKVD